MQIKSWKIAIAGTIPILLLVAIALMIGGNDSEYSFVFGFIVLFGLVIVSIPALCLKSSKDNIRKFGAIMSILFGLTVVIGLLNESMFKGDLAWWGDFILAAVMLAPGFLLLLAGIYYFWKKQ